MESTVTIIDDNKIEVVSVGTSGPPGPPGELDGVLYFYHIQNSVSPLWTIAHNMGYRPNVTIFNSAHDEVQGDIIHLTVNELTVSFSSAFSGSAVLS